MFSTVGVMNRRNVEAWSPAREIAYIVGPGGDRALSRSRGGGGGSPLCRTPSRTMLFPRFLTRRSLFPRVLWWWLWWCHGLVLLLLLQRMTNLQKYHTLGRSLRRRLRLHSLRHHLPRRRLCLLLSLLFCLLLSLLLHLLVYLLLCLLLHLLVCLLLGLALSRPLRVQRMVCWENSCWRTCSLVKCVWRDIVTWSGRLAHGEWPNSFSVRLIKNPWLQLESGVVLNDPTAPLWGSKWPPMRIENDNPLVSITPGELDNDNPWVTLTLTLTGQGLRLIARTQTRTQTRTHTHTHSGSIRPRNNTRVNLIQCW